VCSSDLGAWIEFDITRLVQDWVSGARSNYGLCITCISKVPDPQNLIDEQYGIMNVQWQSRRNVNPPQLVITYGAGSTSPLETTWYEMTTTDGSSVYMDEKGKPGRRYMLPDNTNVQLRGMITARQIGGSAGAIGDTAVYTIDFAIIKRTNGVTALGGSNVANYMKNDAAWNAGLDQVAIQSNNSIELKVNGSANKQVKWRAYLEIWKVS
jgi:hypothetical protein